MFHVAACFTLAALFIVSGFLFGSDVVRGKIEFLSSATLIAYLFAAMLLVLASGHDTLALILFVVLVTSTLAIAWRTDAAALAVPAAAIFVTLIFCIGRSISMSASSASPQVPHPTAWGSLSTICSVRR